MPQNYVVPNISDNLQDRLASITQQILSRTRLLLIVQKLHLYAGDRHLATDDAKVDRMRKDIDIELVRDPNQSISSFRISYTANSPHVAQTVAGELTELFINENLKVREEESERTTGFIENQLDQARDSLAQQEAKVREFESAHEGELPEQQATNLQILAGLQQQMQNETDALNSARQQHVYDEALIQQYRSSHATAARSGAGKAGAATASDLPAIQAQLDKLREQLADLSSRYTDQYPDVVSLKSQIAALETTQERLIAEAKSKAAEAAKNGTAADPVDLSMDAPGMQLQSQLQANELEIANRERAITALKSRIGDYQSRLDATPEAEQQLADLNRGYDQSKANYDDLLKKKDQSAMATDMEQMQQGERFTVLDPPSLPAKPFFPNRLKFCGMGLAFGLALGCAVVGMLEFMDGRMHSEREIKSLLPVAVISEIPEVVSAGDLRSNKQKLTLGWAMTAFVAVTILCGTVFSYLRS
jgi:polysaccharide chain length determinant protein (PEP-CTERM system associated)